MNRTPILILFAFLAEPLSAQVPVGQPSATSVVRTADLDLSRAADRRLLDRRLDRAVIETCGAAADFDVAGANAVARCRSDAHNRLNARRDAVIARSLTGATIEVATRR